MKTDSSWSSAFAPATVANVGPGLDVLGLALCIESDLGDRCAIRLVESGRVVVSITGDDGQLPTEPSQNVASVVAMKVLELAGRQSGFELQLHKGIAPQSGLGSSAASAASAAVAMNRALGNPLDEDGLIEAAREGEQLAANSPHPDNVVPSLLGGFQLMMDDAKHGLQRVSLPVPDGLHVVVVHPDLKVRTRDSRAVLPVQVPMADAIANMGHLAMLVSALYESDMGRLSTNLVDRLHQPYRSSLVKGFQSVVDAALKHGAIGAGLSGSGPSIFALSTGEEKARACGHSMQRAFEHHNVSSSSFVSRVGTQGAIVSVI